MNYGATRWYTAVETVGLYILSKDAYAAGLMLIANVQQDQYVTEVGTTAGLILLIQPQNLMPFPEDRGKLVSPGYQTEFAITQVLQ